MKSVDSVHKQIKHLVVILVEIMRLSVTAQSETKQSKLNKKMYLLQQSISIGQWINEFDPENINTNDLKLPSELNVFQNYVSETLRELQMTTLPQSYNKKEMLKKAQLL